MRVGQGNWLRRIGRRAAEGVHRRRRLWVTVVGSAVLAMTGIGAWLVNERAGSGEPTALVIEPEAIETCGEPATMSADVSIAQGSRLTIRVVPVDAGLRSEDVRRVHVSSAMPRLRLQLKVGPVYSEDRGAPPPQDLPSGSLLARRATPMVGEHLVTVEQAGEVIAQGPVTVLPDDPDTPTTCHTSA